MFKVGFQLNGTDQVNRAITNQFADKLSYSKND